MASRGINVPELTFSGGQHPSRHPAHLNLVSSKLETWAFRPTGARQPMCVFSCIPAKYVSKRAAGMAGTQPPGFPPVPRVIASITVLTQFVQRQTSLVLAS